MGLFKKNEEQEEQPVNMNNVVLIRVLAVGYVLYMAYDMLRMYMAGGEDAPSLGLLIGGLIFLVGGAAWVVVITWKQWKQERQKRQEAYEEEERLAEELADEE